MEVDVSEQHKAQYENRGWTTIRGAVTQERLRVMEQLYDAGVGPYLRPHLAKREVFQYPGACRQNRTLLAEVTEIIGPLAGAILESSRVQLLQDAFVHKAAGCQGTIPWHQDYSYTGYLDPPSTISLRIALSQETPESGCMRVLDGSHRWPMDTPLDIGAMTMDASAIDFLPDDVADSHENYSAWVPLEPGDISVHHCKTLHGSLANATSSARKTIVCHVFDGNSVFDASRLPDPTVAEHFDVDEDGHLWQ